MTTPKARLREGVDAAALAETAEASHGVIFLAGDRCHPNPGEAGTDDEEAGGVAAAEKQHLRSWVRLCFAMLNEEQIDKGIQKLAEAVRASEVS